MSADYIIGDVRDCLAALPDGSVDLVLTSPPFLALRSYLPADHPDKASEIGAEPDPAAFVSTLLGLSAEFRRVLAPHGSIAVELGDTYSGSGGAGGDYADGGMRDGQAKFRQGTPRWDRPNGTRTTTSDPVTYPTRGTTGWPEAKSLTMVPELYRVALAYGIHPLTGEPSPAGRWRCRNVVRWCRPNPPVGALGDKVRPATSDMVIACTSRTRYFDLDAVREPSATGTRVMFQSGSKPDSAQPGNTSRTRADSTVSNNPAGAPPLDHWWADPDTFDNDAWLVSTEAYSGSHYATWPRKLLTRPILAMCPRKVCRTCGEPSRRIAETTNAIGEAVGRRSWRAGTEGIGAGHAGDIVRSSSSAPTAERTTLGWTDCGHDDWRNGLVLDPFGGSGTTLAVATGHGRDAIGFDIDARNAEQAMERVGPMFLTVHTLDEWAPVGVTA